MAKKQAKDAGKGNNTEDQIPESLGKSNLEAFKLDAKYPASEDKNQPVEIARLILRTQQDPAVVSQDEVTKIASWSSIEKGKKHFRCYD